MTTQTIIKVDSHDYTVQNLKYYTFTTTYIQKYLFTTINLPKAVHQVQVAYI
jgi:hypothetical protein